MHFDGPCHSGGSAVLLRNENSFIVLSKKKNSTNIPISGDLPFEIEYWRFLDTWTGSAKWCNQYHDQILKGTATLMISMLNKNTLYDP